MYTILVLFYDGIKIERIGQAMMRTVPVLLVYSLKKVIDRLDDEQMVRLSTTLETHIPEDWDPNICRLCPSIIHDEVFAPLEQLLRIHGYTTIEEDLLIEAKEIASLYGDWETDSEYALFRELVSQCIPEKRGC